MKKSNSFLGYLKIENLRETKVLNLKYVLFLFRERKKEKKKKVGQRERGTHCVRFNSKPSFKPKGYFGIIYKYL